MGDASGKRAHDSGSVLAAAMCRRIDQEGWICCKIRDFPRGGSSDGRASRSQCEGRGFDPLPLHHGLQRPARCRRRAWFFCPARAPILQATIALLVGVLVLPFVAMTAYLLYAQAQRDLGLFWMLVNEPPPAAARS